MALTKTVKSCQQTNLVLLYPTKKEMLDALTKCPVPYSILTVGDSSAEEYFQSFNFSSNIGFFHLDLSSNYALEDWCPLQAVQIWKSRQTLRHNEPLHRFIYWDFFCRSTSQ